MFFPTRWLYERVTPIWMTEPICSYQSLFVEVHNFRISNESRFALEIVNHWKMVIFEIKQKWHFQQIVVKEASNDLDFVRDPRT